MRPTARHLGRLLLAALALCGPGCAMGRSGRDTPTAAGLAPRLMEDPDGLKEEARVVGVPELYRQAERLRLRQRDALPRTARPRSVLAVSAGGDFGAYPAGVLTGWTARGDRPEFDVVTGVSTGALIAVFAFAGPAYDAQLEDSYTRTEASDVYRRYRLARALLSDSLASPEPLRQSIERTLTPDLMAHLAAEHAKGRRLYIGTTILDGRRQVVWDMGAIASRGDACALRLLRDILQATSAIPGFFPPVDIDVTVDGRRYTERHIDGAVSTSVFVRPPVPAPGKDGQPGEGSYTNVDVYVLIAGKLFANAEVVSTRALSIASTSVSTLTYSQTRDELRKIYSICVYGGANFNATALPDAFEVSSDATDFDNEEMVRMYREGQRRLLAGEAFRNLPPGINSSELPSLRLGTRLTGGTGGGGATPAEERPGGLPGGLPPGGAPQGAPGTDSVPAGDGVGGGTAPPAGNSLPAGPNAPGGVPNLPAGQPPVVPVPSVPQSEGGVPGTPGSFRKR